MGRIYLASGTGRAQERSGFDVNGKGNQRLGTVLKREGEQAGRTGKAESA